MDVRLLIVLDMSIKRFSAPGGEKCEKSQINTYLRALGIEPPAFYER